MNKINLYKYEFILVLILQNILIILLISYKHSFLVGTLNGKKNYKSINEGEYDHLLGLYLIYIQCLSLVK